MYDENKEGHRDPSSDKGSISAMVYNFCHYLSWLFLMSFLGLFY